jgi:hypothetical protein
MRKLKAIVLSSVVVGAIGVAAWYVISELVGPLLINSLPP